MRRKGAVRADGVVGDYMCKVSVIVPVYNVAAYLSECLNSILNQTLEEIEVICIDDGSTDGSGEILDRYAEQDQRIKALHQKNRGYGGAMNAGLDVAAGEFIGIVESDDCIQPDMYETLYMVAVSEELDLVKSEAYYWYESIGYQKRIHYSHLDPYFNKVLGGLDRNILCKFYMNIWTGIYRKDFLYRYGIRFHESPGASYQDNGFWMQTILYCRRAKWLNRAFYQYRQDNETASIKRKDKILAMTEEYEYLEKVLRDRENDQLLPYCYQYKLFRHIGNFYRIADEYKREFCEQIKKDYTKYMYFSYGDIHNDNWLREATLFPDRLCKRVIQKKEEIKKRLNESAGVIIYGAGIHGEQVLRGLYSEGYYEKICCFAVSDKPLPELIAKKQVLRIDEALEVYSGALVIVAVAHGSKAYSQMLAKLEQLGVWNYLDGNDIEENYYIA